MQSAPSVRNAQRVKARFGSTVADILNNQQRLIEECLLGFGLLHTMLVGALSSITEVPLKSNDTVDVKHLVYDHNIRYCALVKRGQQRRARQ